MNKSSTAQAIAPLSSGTGKDHLLGQHLLTTRFCAQDLVAVRAHAREAADLAGLVAVQQIRFATAVSEISRNAAQYATEGAITLSVVPSSSDAILVAEVSDQGPGISDLETVLAGGTKTMNGRVPMGIVGSKRLVDNLIVTCPAGGGTRVRIEMKLPRGAPRLDGGDLTRFSIWSTVRKTISPQVELDKQNRELLRTLQELREKQAELQKADEMKNHFITMLAHELRSPLSTLHMSVELMRRAPQATTEERATRLDVMARQTVQMTKLVDDLLDGARVRQGKVQLAKVPLELNTLVAHSVEMTGAALVAKSHSLSVVLHDRPLWVLGDESRLIQVLCNLIQNAASYTPPSGAISIEVGREEATAVIEVQDNGIGISAEMLPHIFGVFVQCGERDGTTQGGLGLGLSLVQHLVHDHGGTVSATSAGLGKGTQFLLTLPTTAAPLDRPHRV